VQWEAATSASGKYVADFPSVPSIRTQQTPGSPLVVHLTEAQSGGNAFTLSETALGGTPPLPLDEAVDNAIERSRMGSEVTAGRTVTAKEISRSTGDFEGSQTRRFTYELIDGDKTATVNSLLFYRNDAIVQAIVVYAGKPDEETVNHFLSSLKSKSG
jgi:hypothetical protein